MTSEAVHALETRLIDSGEPLELPEIVALQQTWRQFASRVSAVLHTRDGMVEISVADYQAVRAAVRNTEQHAVIEQLLEELQYEPAECVLSRAAERARELALRLGKGEIDIQVRTNGLRLDPERWHKLWSAFVHAIRNSVDRRKGARSGAAPRNTSRARGGALPRGLDHARRSQRNLRAWLWHERAQAGGAGARGYRRAQLPAGQGHTTAPALPRKLSAFLACFRAAGGERGVS